MHSRSSRDRYLLELQPKIKTTVKLTPAGRNAWRRSGNEHSSHLLSGTALTCLSFLLRKWFKSACSAQVKHFLESIKSNSREILEWCPSNVQYTPYFFQIWSSYHLDTRIKTLRFDKMFWPHQKTTNNIQTTKSVSEKLLPFNIIPQINTFKSMLNTH